MEFIRLRGRTPGVSSPLNRFLAASVTRRLAGFYGLTGHDVVGDAHAGLQRPLSQRYGSSLHERHGTAQYTAEQAAQPISPPQEAGTDEVGQCNTCLT